MKMFKRIGFMMALALVLAVSVGCAKKQPGTVGEGYGEGDGLTPEMRQAYSVIQDQKIYFDFDRFDIRSEYQNVLREKADVLKRYPQINVLIEGHCDERGTEEYNMALGERRARAAWCAWRPKTLAWPTPARCAWRWTRARCMNAWAAPRASWRWPNAWSTWLSPPSPTPSTRPTTRPAPG